MRRRGVLVAAVAALATVVCATFVAVAANSNDGLGWPPTAIRDAATAESANRLRDGEYGDSAPLRSAARRRESAPLLTRERDGESDRTDVASGDDISTLPVAMRGGGHTSSTSAALRLYSCQLGVSFGRDCIAGQTGIRRQPGRTEMQLLPTVSHVDSSSATQTIANVTREVYDNGQVFLRVDIAVHRGVRTGPFRELRQDCSPLSRRGVQERLTFADRLRCDSLDEDWLEGLLEIEGRGAVPFMLGVVKQSEGFDAASGGPDVATASASTARRYRSMIDVTEYATLASPPASAYRDSGVTVAASPETDTRKAAKTVPSEAGVHVAAMLYVWRLFADFKAINDDTEMVAMPYDTALSSETVVRASVALFGSSTSPTKQASRQGSRSAARGFVVGAGTLARWRDVGKDTQNHRTSWLRGYWLPLRSDPSDAGARSTQRDVLGRMNFGRLWRRERTLMALDAAAAAGGLIAGMRGGDDGTRGSSFDTPSTLSPLSVESLPFFPPRLRVNALLGKDEAGAVAAPCDVSCWKSLLRGRALYFIGDSHMRILFYGLLSRLRIAYPHDKVWRGDRSDELPDVQGKVAFVASYFLNLTRPSAVAMLAEAAALSDRVVANGRRDVVIVAGVGQHHASSCWSLRKHRANVDEAMSVLTSASRQRGKVLWFGTPAQTVNRHLFMSKKQGGQGRVDCRSNARHLLYNLDEMQLAARHGVPFVDAFGDSFGMGHTSLDGAHFYTWVRDAWLEQIAFYLRSL